MGEWILVVVLFVNGRVQIDSTIIYASRPACESALAVKEGELRGQVYGLACLPAGRLP